jgi:hypothetical protein
MLTMDHRSSIEVSIDEEAARIEERKLASLRRMSYLNHGFSKLDAAEPNKRLHLCSGAVIMGGPKDGNCVPRAHLCSLKNRSDYAAVVELRKRVVATMGANRERYEPVVLQGPNDGGDPETMFERHLDRIKEDGTFFGESELMCLADLSGASTVVDAVVVKSGVATRTTFEPAQPSSNQVSHLLMLVCTADSSHCEAVVTESARPTGSMDAASKELTKQSKADSARLKALKALGAARDAERLALRMSQAQAANDRAQAARAARANEQAVIKTTAKEEAAKEVAVKEAAAKEAAKQEAAKKKKEKKDQEAATKAASAKVARRNQAEEEARRQSEANAAARALAAAAEAEIARLVAATKKTAAARETAAREAKEAKEAKAKVMGKKAAAAATAVTAAAAANKAASAAKTVVADGTITCGDLESPGDAACDGARLPPPTPGGCGCGGGGVETGGNAARLRFEATSFQPGTMQVHCLTALPQFDAATKTSMLPGFAPPPGANCWAPNAAAVAFYGAASVEGRAARVQVCISTRCAHTCALH